MIFRIGERSNLVVISDTGTCTKLMDSRDLGERCSTDLLC